MDGSGLASAFNAEKVFCIGLSRTGTTSLEQALQDLGYRLGDQHQGELLLPQYAVRNFRPIVEFCLTADAFQDAPFSFPFTYLALDQSFPNAKFILSVRDSSEQWYRSLVRYHSNLFGRGHIPTKDDLVRATYSYPGFVWESVKVLLNASEEEEIYDKPRLVSYYDRHNSNVRDYFRAKSNLLEINVSTKGAYGKLCDFLDKKPIAEDFPWLNSSLPSPASDREG
jgi:Sulfotransferase domain